MKRPWFHGWWIVIAGAAIQFVMSALMLQSFGFYAAALVKEFGWSRGTVGAAFSFARVEGPLGPPQGWMVSHFGARLVLQIGVVILAGGFFLFAVIDSLWQFFVFYIVMSVGATLGGFPTITIATVSWFDRFRSTALGVSAVGFALGGITASSAVAYAIVEFGWRETSMVSGVLTLVLGLPLTFLFHNRPEDIGQHVDGISPEEREAYRAAQPARAFSTDVDYTLGEAMRTRAFWTISLGHASALLVVTAVQVHLVLHLTNSLGYSDGAARWILTSMIAMQAVGQVAGGMLGDWVSKRLIVIACMGMHAVGLLLIAWAGGNLLAVVGFSVLHGIAWGTRGPMMQAIRADYFGRTHFGAISGWSTAITTIGPLLGPIIAGVLYDWTDSYRLGFTVVALMAAAGSIFFVLSTRPAPPQRAAAETAVTSAAGA
ncbi:MAG: MFS transporter [Dehalococcoidia bacterium]|nr:MAG: MFS transporter [Dehalococcoidia bacterium]